MPRPEPDPLLLRQAGVTRRELDVFWLVAQRLQNREIADRLHLSERTVESHVSSLLGKLELADRRALIAVAARLGEDQAARSRLPAAFSSFVGREKELAELSTLVRAHRLVTLVGTAGSGKTRLALEVAHAADAMPPPVLVDLALAAAGAGVERFFATALGLTEEGAGLARPLTAAVAAEPCWLLVDNCEHVLEKAGRLLAGLLTSASDLHVLATSQSPLGIAGEYVYEVAPLPKPADTDDLTTILGAAACRLFAERAAAAAPGFEVDSGNAGDVARLCRRLDGLPLAIELAAARVRAFAPAELLSRLDDRFEILAASGVGNRHPSLEAALRWSYDLLEAPEQLLFERCAVFAGDFDYDTAAEVLAFPPLTSRDVARLFPRLLDRSLIAAARHGQWTEYRMLDTVRQFARQRLGERGELETVEAAHARHHLEHGRRALPDLQGRDQEGALRWFDRRWADIRAAVRWALDHDEAKAAWGFMAGIGLGWDVIGIKGDLFDWLDRLLEEPLPEGAFGVRAAVTASFLYWFQQPARSLVLAKSACALAEREDAWTRALARLELGRALSGSFQQEAASGYLEAAAAEFGALGDEWHQAVALEFLSNAQLNADATLSQLGSAAVIFGRLGDRVLRANCFNQMGNRCVDSNLRLDEAQTWLEEGHRLAELAGNKHELLHAELMRARLDQLRGDHRGTIAQFRKLLPEFTRLGDSRCVARCLLGIGWAAAAEGDEETARRQLENCVEVSEVTSQVQLASALRLLAQLEAPTRPRQAARMLGAADAVAAMLDPERRAGLIPDSEAREALERELGSTEFASLMTQGRQTSPTQLLAAAPHGSDGDGGIHS